MRFFFDNNIAVKIARAVAELASAQGIEVVHLTDRFDQAVRDIDWISALREEGDWVIVSGDIRISKSRAERAAWHESGLTAFFLDENWPRKRFWVQSLELVKWFPIIVETAGQCAPGSGYKLPSQGKAPKLIYTPGQ